MAASGVLRCLVAKRVFADLSDHDASELFCAVKGNIIILLIRPDEVSSIVGSESFH